MDCIANACGMLFTERNQPIRVFATASPVSSRRLGTLNGVSIRPRPSSRALSRFGSGMKLDMSDGETLR